MSFPSAARGFGVLLVLGGFGSTPVPFWDKGRALLSPVPWQVAAEGRAACLCQGSAQPMLGGTGSTGSTATGRRGGCGFGGVAAGSRTEGARQHRLGAAEVGAFLLPTSSSLPGLLMGEGCSWQLQAQPGVELGLGGPWQGVIGLGGTCCTPKAAEGAVSQLGTSRGGGTRSTEQCEQLALLPTLGFHSLFASSQLRGAVGLHRENNRAETLLLLPAAPLTRRCPCPCRALAAQAGAPGGWKRCKRPGWL